MLKLKRILRRDVKIEASVREDLRTWDKVGVDQLELHRIDNFELKVAATRGKKGEKGIPARVEEISRDVVVLKDIAGTLDWIIEKRGMDKDKTIFRVNIDGGGDSLKVVANIFHAGEDSEIMFTSLEQPGRRLSGVNRFILLAYIENLQESWHNLRILLELLQLDRINYRFTSDLKIINIVLGISSHSGKYACHICYGTCQLTSGPLCTFQNLKYMFEIYCEEGFPHKRMQDFSNVVKPCLINPSNLNLEIGDVIAPPQLHLHIGVANWAWDLTKQLLGPERYQELVN